MPVAIWLTETVDFYFALVRLPCASLEAAANVEVYTGGCADPPSGWGVRAAQPPGGVGLTHPWGGVPTQPGPPDVIRPTFTAMPKTLEGGVAPELDRDRH